MNFPFAFWKAAAGPDNPLWSGVDGNLHVLNNQVVSLNANDILYYNNVTVDVGGAISINEGTGGWLQMGVKGNFILNGNMYLNQCTDFGGEYSTTAVDGTALFYTNPGQGGGGRGGGQGYSGYEANGGEPNSGNGGAGNFGDAIFESGGSGPGGSFDSAGGGGAVLSGGDGTSGQSIEGDSEQITIAACGGGAFRGYGATNAYITVKGNVTLNGIIYANGGPGGRGGDGGFDTNTWVYAPDPGFLTNVAIGGSGGGGAGGGSGGSVILNHLGTKTGTGSINVSEGSGGAGGNGGGCSGDTTSDGGGGEAGGVGQPGEFAINQL